MNTKRGFILRQEKGITAPMIACDSCGEMIRDYGMAWIMWQDRPEEGVAFKPLVLCKKNRCNSKPEYLALPSMELGDFLINLCRNAGMKTEEDFREAFELAELADRIG